MLGTELLKKQHSGQHDRKRRLYSEPTGMNGTSNTSAQEVERYLQRHKSLPNLGDAYHLLERGPIDGTPQDETLYHITTQDNFEKIVESGGLMPVAHQPEKGSGLDDLRSGLFNSVASEVGDYLNIKSNPEIAQSSYYQAVLKKKKQDAEDALKEGINPQNLYMSKGEASIEYYRTRFPDQNTVLFRAKINAHRSGFVRDIQGGLDDLRATGLKIPLSYLEAVKISSATKEIDFERLEWQSANDLFDTLSELKNLRARLLEPAESKHGSLESLGSTPDLSELADLTELLDLPDLL